MGDDEELDDEDELGALEGDCYFPRDGYNYDQHLKRVSGTGKGTSVAGVVLNAPKPKKSEKELFPQATDISLQPAMTEEEREVLQALDNAEEFEEMDEAEFDELIPAGAAADLDEVLWGPT